MNTIFRTKNLIAALVAFLVPVISMAAGTLDPNNFLNIGAASGYQSTSEQPYHVGQLNDSGLQDVSLTNNSDSFNPDTNNFSGQDTSSYNDSVDHTSGTPDFEIIGVSQVQLHYAEVRVSYDYDGAKWDKGYAPAVYLQVENDDTGETETTTIYYGNSGTRTMTWSLYSLDKATRYNYRAIMKFGGRTYKTDWKSFSTKGTVSTSTNSNSSNTSNNQNPVIPTPTKVASDLGVTKVTGAVKSAINTSGSNHSNGVAIGITDTQARVSNGDVIDFTVQYQNTRTTSLQNAELAIVLPEEYEYISSKYDFEYDESSNIITLPIGRVAAGGAIKTVTFKARAIGDGSRDVKTTATLYYEGGKISASDRDAYHGGSKSVLGASVFGAGFFPQTFVGWILVILLITVLIIAARRYAKAPTPAPAPAPAK